VGPFCSSRKSRGARLQGERYERRFGRFLKRASFDTELLSGQWFEYEDVNGPGWAQTDHILVYPAAIIVFECKLTQHRNARLQLEDLYLPLVRCVWPDYFYQLVEVFQHSTEVLLDISREVHALGGILEYPREDDTHIWQWMGQ
jgi:hypothetical protein